MIPVIDLDGDFSSCESKEALMLREASEGLGCFRVINHGVPLQLMADMKSLGADLMDLPEKMKRDNKYFNNGIGYMAPTPTNPNFEAFGLVDASSSSAIDQFCSLLNLSPLQRRTVEKYAEAIHRVTTDVANKLGKSMGLESDQTFEGWPSHFRINKYNFSASTVGSLGIQTHTDAGFMNLLQDDDNVGGLEIKDLSGKFVAVDPFPGSLVVILGDTAVVWSNGRLHNVQHRVQCKEATKRYSVVTVIAPPKDVVIQVPKEFIDDEHPRLYSSFTHDELRRLRWVHKVATGEVLDLLRLRN